MFYSEKSRLIGFWKRTGFDESETTSNPNPQENPISHHKKKKKKDTLT
jgi:hypothetical protein